MINCLSTLYKKSAAILIGCFFVLSCENKIEDVQNLNKKTIGIEEGKQIESFLSQNGKVKAKLMAPLMLRYQTDTPRVEFPKTLRVDFYNDSTKIESKLFAKYGRYQENENKVFLRDSVIVFNISGDTLICKELYWDQLKATFYTDKKVIIKKPDQKIYGSGLVADQNFQWFTITKV
ncbi:MAG TPA: LPS export ABC transporter periplasmic protein LptC, partial [Segetibacter sp.]